MKNPVSLPLTGHVPDHVPAGPSVHRFHEALNNAVAFGRPPPDTGTGTTGVAGTTRSGCPTIKEAGHCTEPEKKASGNIVNLANDLLACLKAGHDAGLQLNGDARGMLGSMQVGKNGQSVGDLVVAAYPSGGGKVG